MSNFYITTPIYYVNARPHLGHAYTTIVADALTRFHRMLGDKTLFLTGSDEHGDKIVQAAEKMNMSPQAFVDETSSHFRKLWPNLSVAPDHFTRTTDKQHERAVQDFLTRLYEAGDIYFGEFGGWYCYGCERFYTEKELENGLCPQHQVKPEFISEKNYFFRMSRYLPWLAQYMREHPDMIRPERYMREALAMLEEGVLDDLCISRPKTRLSWGIELPFDRNYVCYVWFDALISYLSALGWPDGEEYREFWPGSHLIAKDILKPHAIFWPCMLKAANVPIYRHLDVHGYWLSRDSKMSKSLGNVIDPLDMLERFGLDAFRYFLLREMNFGSDANFSEEAIIQRINADLANDLGNLFSRVLSMAAKFLNSTVPQCGHMAEADKLLMENGLNAAANYLDLFPECHFSRALESLWTFVRLCNKYVDTEAPWSLHKNGDLERLNTVMAILLAGMRKTAILLWPVMPDASVAMLAQLGEKLPGNGESPVPDIQEEAKIFLLLKSGTRLAPVSNLFPRIDAKAIKISVSEKLPEKQAENVPAKALADIQSFRQLEMRAGTIIEASKHPDADRILVLKTDFGEGEPRQILSALAEFYGPEELAGRRICAILNLKPRKIRGLMSNGMVLTVEADNKVVLLEPPAAMPNGAVIG